MGVKLRILGLCSGSVVHKAQPQRFLGLAKVVHLGRHQGGKHGLGGEFWHCGPAFKFLALASLYFWSCWGIVLTFAHAQHAMEQLDS